MDTASLFRRSAATVNKAVVPLLHSGAGQRLLGNSFAVLTYTGRRSGRQVTVPVNYRRDKGSGDVVIKVLGPDAKTWWRNFTGAGSDVQVRLGAEVHRGHAQAICTGRKVTVRVVLSA